MLLLTLTRHDGGSAFILSSILDLRAGYVFRYRPLLVWLFFWALFCGTQENFHMYFPPLRLEVPDHQIRPKIGPFRSGISSHRFEINPEISPIEFLLLTLELPMETPWGDTRPKHVWDQPSYVWVTNADHIGWNQACGVWNSPPDATGTADHMWSLDDLFNSI